MVTDRMLQSLKAFELDDTFLIVPASAVPLHSVSDYWVALHEADTLKYRWSDITDPKPIDIIEYANSTPHMYYVVDVKTAIIVGEFALCNFTGKAAQVHFSMHPDNHTSLSMFLAATVSDKILYQWKDITNLEESYIDTLYGLTPKKNRVACLFIRKVGFKQVGTLASGTRYLNEIDDALLTTKSRMN